MVFNPREAIPLFHVFYFNVLYFTYFKKHLENLNTNLSKADNILAGTGRKFLTCGPGKLVKWTCGLAVERVCVDVVG